MASGLQQILIGIGTAGEPPIFTAVASSGTNRVMYSNDGIAWTAAAAAEANSWNSIAYSPTLKRLVAVSTDGTNRIMYSRNGIAWSLGTNPSVSKSWQSVCWSPELAIFVAIDNAGGTDGVMTSSDGITWANANAASWNGASGTRAVAWSPALSIFAATSSGGTAWMSSPDGTTWTARTGFTGQGTAVAWSPDLAIFASIGSNVSNPVAASSTNGTSWTSRNVTNSGPWNDVCWAHTPGIFIAVGGNAGTQTQYSSNGTSWSSATASNVANWTSVAWSESLQIAAAVSDNGTHSAMSSTTGTSGWTERTASEGNAWKSVVASG